MRPRDPWSVSGLLVRGRAYWVSSSSSVGLGGSLSDLTRIQTRLRKSLLVDGLRSPSGFLLMARPVVMLSAKEMWSFVVFWQNGFNRHFPAASMLSAAEKRWGV